MPLSQWSIRTAALRNVTQRASSLNEAKRLGFRTAFLCHSHKDSALVMGVVALLREAGWAVYVDWQDASMPATPSRVTAQKIKDRILLDDLFLFLATQNSMTSRWCPWEIGYADGVKPIDAILIIPTSDDGGRTHGSEYLDLYRRIDVADAGGLAAWQPRENHNGVFVRNL